MAQKDKPAIFSPKYTYSYNLHAYNNTHTITICDWACENEEQKIWLWNSTYNIFWSTKAMMITKSLCYS